MDHMTDERKMRNAELAVIHAAHQQRDPSPELRKALEEYDRTHVFTEVETHQEVHYGDV